MKMIVIMGPHGAGKDTVISELLKIFNSEKPGFLQKSLYTTTRAPRADETEGRDVLFCTEEEFHNMVKDKSMVTYASIRNYHTGTTLAEYTKSPLVIINILFSVIYQLEERFKNNNLELLKIYINAPIGERRIRIKSRDPKTSPEEVEARVTQDPNLVTEEDLGKMDLVIENSNGKLPETVKAIAEKIKEFIKE